MMRINTPKMIESAGLRCAMPMVMVGSPCWSTRRCAVISPPFERRLAGATESWGRHRRGPSRLPPSLKRAPVGEVDLLARDELQEDGLAVLVHLPRAFQRRNDVRR